MAILKIKDANGNVQEILSIKGKDGKDGINGADGKDGKDYVLTEEDKHEIADMVTDSLGVVFDEVHEYAESLGGDKA